MTVESTLQIVFAVAAVLAVVSIVAAIFRPPPRTLLAGVALAFAAASAAAWVFFALDPDLERAVAAAGLALCGVAEVSAGLLAAALERRRQADGELARAEGRLTAVIDEEAEQRAAELARTLTRARADAASLLAEEERKLAADRQRLVAEHERQLRGQLAEALTRAQQRVEQRLGAWSSDLEQLQQTMKADADRLAKRQSQLVAEAEERIDADARRLDAASEEQRTTVSKLRSEFAAAVEVAFASATDEIEEHAGERRRALHEVSERLRRRERELREQIGREEAEAMQRIKSDFADVERRQVDQLERLVERAAQRYAEAAELQFAAAVKTAREEAARRLGRELERASAVFVREGESLLAQGLAHIGDAGAQRLEKKFADTEAVLARRQEEILRGLEDRLVEAEADLRRRLGGLEADIESERGILEARLHELARRLDEALAAAGSSVQTR